MPTTTAISPVEITSLAALAWTWVAAFTPRLLAAIVLLVVGLYVAGWTRRGVDRLTQRTHWVDRTVRPFLLGVVQYAVIIMMVILVLNQVGIETSSLLAILGAAGIAVGLALQGTLSNIAAGIMLLWLRPFELGDYIEVNGLSGTVEETGLFAATLTTFDGAKLFAPNSTLWNFALRNHSRASGRLLALSITLVANADRKAAMAALQSALAAEPGVRQQPAPLIFLDSMVGSAPTLACRFWVDQGYSVIQRSIAEKLLGQLEASGTPADGIQVMTRLVPLPADPTRLMDI